MSKLENYNKNITKLLNIEIFYFLLLYFNPEINPTGKSKHYNNPLSSLSDKIITIRPQHFLKRDAILLQKFNKIRKKNIP